MHQPSVAPGERVYAVSGIHGCIELLGRLVARIRDDNGRRPSRRTKLLFLGGLIDRGPHSADVVAHLRQLTQQTSKLIVLKGSDEQMMVQALAGDLDILEAWLCRGGDAALRSWGLERAIVDGPLPDLLNSARSAIDRDLIRWLDDLPLHHRSGDYFFVHAGVRPGVSLDEQREEDLLWIGEEFLDHEDDHEAVIVHGQSATDSEPDMLHHRIGLPTGGYWSGTLSAVGLEGAQRWVVTT